MTARETVEQALDRLSMDAAVWRTNPDTVHQAIGVDIAVHRVYDALAALAALPVATAGPETRKAIADRLTTWLIERQLAPSAFKARQEAEAFSQLPSLAAALRGAAAQADGGEPGPLRSVEKLLREADWFGPPGVYPLMAEEWDDAVKAVAQVIVRASRAGTAPGWPGPGERPHSYSPDYQAMGDCKVCGHVREDHEATDAELRELAIAARLTDPNP